MSSLLQRLLCPFAPQHAVRKLLLLIHCSYVCSVRTVLLSIQSLLGEPNNDSPLNSYAAKLWENQEEYKRVLTKKYAEAQK